MPRAINRRQWDENDLAWLRAWAKRGKTAAQIAAKLGRTVGSVRGKAQKEGIRLRLRGQPAHYSNEVVKAALRRILAGETQRRIARDLGVSHSTISHWLNVRGAAYRVSDLIGD